MITSNLKRQIPIFKDTINRKVFRKIVKGHLFFIFVLIKHCRMQSVIKIVKKEMWKCFLIILSSL